MRTFTRYGQFCPVAMAAEVLCSRWTILLLREMLAGSTRFNELRRGLPRMSPALLAQRLRDLEEAGIVVREEPPQGGTAYSLTRAGQDLREVMETMGFWGQRWIDADLSLRNLDAQLLMWDMRRNVDPQPVPQRRVVIRFLYPEQPQGRRRWWLVVDRGTVDLLRRPRLRRRPLRRERPAHDDEDLDGPRHRRRRGGGRPPLPHRRRPARPLDARLARPQPLRPRDEE
jgi:DNA-binding HxlR family transcriptional regulator